MGFSHDESVLLILNIQMKAFRFRHRLLCRYVNTTCAELWGPEGVFYLREIVYKNVIFFYRFHSMN